MSGGRAAGRAARGGPAAAHRGRGHLVDHRADAAGVADRDRRGAAARGALRHGAGPRPVRRPAGDARGGQHRDGPAAGGGRAVRHRAAVAERPARRARVAVHPDRHGHRPGRDRHPDRRRADGRGAPAGRPGLPAADARAGRDPDAGDRGTARRGPVAAARGRLGRLRCGGERGGCRADGRREHPGRDPGAHHRRGARDQPRPVRSGHRVRSRAAGHRLRGQPPRHPRPAARGGEGRGSIADGSGPAGADHRRPDPRRDEHQLPEPAGLRPWPSPARGGLPGGRRRRDGGRARSERCGEVDAAPGARPPRAGSGRRGAPRRRAGPADAAARRGRGRAAAPRPATGLRARQRRRRPAAAGNAPGREPADSPGRGSTHWGSRTSPIVTPARCPAARSNAWPSPELSPSGRECCCSTSRSPGWTPPPGPT